MLVYQRVFPSYPMIFSPGQGRCIEGGCLCFAGFSGVDCSVQSCCNGHGSCEVRRLDVKGWDSLLDIMGYNTIYIYSCIDITNNVWRDNGDTIGIQLGYNGIYQIRI
jgi:hypothetical protein